jgi:two-component system response regulator ChvI
MPTPPPSNPSAPSNSSAGSIAGSPTGSATTTRVVAVVEDEETLREMVALALRQQGYAVERHADGLAAWERFAQALPDLVLLDIGLPRLDGLDLCRRLRARSAHLPIIFVTSREEELDRVLGLELGADDYVCKPFSMRELMARVKVLLRRASLSGVPDSALADGAALAAGAAPASADATVVAGSLRLDLLRYTARWDDRPVALTVTEFLLLQALAQRPGQVKTRQDLMQHAYPDNTFVSDRTIDSHIKRLRRKFEAIDERFDRLDAVYGLGYRFRADE